MEADVRDGDLVADLLRGSDALVHLAFIVTPHLPREVFEAINIEGSKNVFRAAAAAGVRRIVYCSSLAAYAWLWRHRREILARHGSTLAVENRPAGGAEFRIGF